MSSKTHQGELFDLLDSSSVTSELESFPWIQVDLIRNYSVTMIAFLSGNEQLLNIDIRVGKKDVSPNMANGNQRITMNERCGMYYGPTLVSNQWVEIDCGFVRGISGRFVTLQATSGLPTLLELAEIEVHGWGNIC